MSKVELHILTFNEEEILPYTLRHYRSFCSRMVCHDSFSTDQTRAIAAEYGAEVKDWDTGGCLNDEMAMGLKNECWKGTAADWVICVDADEIVYFPKGVEYTLAAYTRAAVIKPHGFDMYAQAFPKTCGQIYDEVKRGAESNKWYAKPVLFNPRIVAQSGFGIGAHESHPVLKDGRTLYVGADWPKANPPTYLLHFHHGIGPPERVAARLDAKRKRLARVNEIQRWGNFKPGAEHVREKLDYILLRLQQVIA